MDPQGLGQAQGEGPDAAEQVGDAAGAGKGVAYETSHGRLGLGRGLQEAARGQGDDGPADGDHRQAGLIDDLSSQRDAGGVHRRRRLGRAQAGVGR